MRTFVFILTFLVSAAATAEILTFQEWKVQQIYLAQKEVHTAAATKKEQPSRRPRGVVADSQAFASPVKDMARKELQKMAGENRAEELAQARLQAARELTVQDYFEIYLNSQPNREKAFEEVAKKLSSEEMADLLLAYSKLLSAEQQ